jgi:tetratricopeptide (TPR) repeat protein
MKKYLLYKTMGAVLIALQLSLFTFSQTTPSGIVKDKNGNDMLWGICTRSDMEKSPYDSWFVSNYQNYRIDSSLRPVLTPGLEKKIFTIFFGSWCGDSQREVPRMLKTLQYYGVDPKQIKLVAVSNHPEAYKQSSGREEKGLYIHRVPTLVVSNSKKEIGRIIESPVESLEKDLAKIVGVGGYVANYGDISGIIEFIKQTPSEKLTEAMTLQLPTWKETVKNVYHLNSLGYLLTTNGDWDKAITAFTINAQLYPADNTAFKCLADIYAKRGKTDLAKVYYRKLLETNPANLEVKTALEQLK